MKIILFFKYLPHIAAFSVASVNVLNLAPQNFVFKLFERQPCEAPEVIKLGRYISIKYPFRINFTFFLKKSNYIYYNINTSNFNVVFSTIGTTFCLVCVSEIIKGKTRIIFSTSNWTCWCTS